MTRAAAGDFQHAAAAVRRMSFARLAIAGFVFVAVLMDPPEGVPFPQALQLLLAGFMLYSAATVAATAAAPVGVFRLSGILHLVDLAWAIAATSITGGADSPFFILFLFGQLAAGYRWGWRPALYTTVAAVVVLLLQAASVTFWTIGSPVHLHTVLLRALSLGVGGVLIGLLAEEERHLRRQALAVTRILSRVRVGAGLVASIRAVFEEVLAEFGGTRRAARAGGGGRRAYLPLDRGGR
ncbi:MAG: hypothetical protein ACE148_15455 [Vicinamibacterales bacterium]